MNKQELEIAKKIAEIEGVEFECTEYSENFPSPLCTLKANGYEYEEYNPFDWATLGPLMVKYEVSIEHPCEHAFITQGWSQISTGFSDKSEIPRAILECIIKSKED